MTKKGKKILINALYLKWGVNGGTETYLNIILRRWYFEPSQIGTSTITLLCNQAPSWWQGDKPNFMIKVLPQARFFGFRFIFEQFVLPIYSLGHDLIYQPAYVGSVL